MNPTMDNNNNNGNGKKHHPQQDVGISNQDQLLVVVQPQQQPIQQQQQQQSIQQSTYSIHHSHIITKAPSQSSLIGERPTNLTMYTSPPPTSTIVNPPFMNISSQTHQYNQNNVSPILSVQKFGNRSSTGIATSQSSIIKHIASPDTSTSTGSSWNDGQTSPIVGIVSIRPPSSPQASSIPHSPKIQSQQQPLQPLQSQQQQPQQQIIKKEKRKTKEDDEYEEQQQQQHQDQIFYNNQNGNLNNNNNGDTTATTTTKNHSNQSTPQTQSPLQISKVESLYISPNISKSNNGIQNNQNNSTTTPPIMELSQDPTRYVVSTSSSTPPTPNLVSSSNSIIQSPILTASTTNLLTTTTTTTNNQLTDNNNNNNNNNQNALALSTTTTQPFTITPFSIMPNEQDTWIEIRDLSSEISKIAKSCLTKGITEDILVSIKDKGNYLVKMIEMVTQKEKLERKVEDDRSRIPPLTRPRRFRKKKKLSASTDVVTFNESSDSMAITSGSTTPGQTPLSPNVSGSFLLDDKKKREPYCTSCGTTQTPEWRKGPAGGKSLCNACGLHYAKLMKKEGQVKENQNTSMNVVNLLN